MAFNVSDKDSRVISVDVLGSLVTETTPASLPTGVSPDNGDVEFLPGSVNSRRGLQKIFTIKLPNNATVVWGKSYVQPNGTIDNLYLDSNGIIWLEDPINSPGNYTQIGTTTPGSFCRSATAFGREYIAISDGLHGQEVPLQWDGTSLTRVTQDAPGAPPLVASQPLPAVTMGANATITLTIRESDPANLAGGVYTQINMWTLTSVAGVNAGASCTISGYTGASAGLNGTWTVLAVYPGSAPTGNLVVLAANITAPCSSSTSAASAAVSAAEMVRQGNVVTVNTQSAHGLKVGYQAQISNVADTSIGAGASITIDNEALPGLATVTTVEPHGLYPENYVSIIDVNPVPVGTSITSIKWSGGIVTVITSTAHGLTPGSVVEIVGTSNYNVGAVAVLSVPSTTSFTYAWTPLNIYASESAGGVSITWPVPDTETPFYYQVVACPTPTTFQVQIEYSDCTFVSGTITFPWQGIFYVTAVPAEPADGSGNPLSFQYQQYGPNASTSAEGTVTPYGQAAPGQRQVQVLFMKENGAITAPGPSATFITAGGQFVAVSNIPTGPPGIVARILAFTLADGQYFFYIPTPAQINGQVISTATVIYDNVTTSVLLDFADNTLAAGLGISIPGNNLANQEILDGCLGFGFFDSRLIAWGMRNNIQNLLSMSFDGGYLPSVLYIPCGWTAADSNGGLQAAHYGQGWGITVQSGGGQCGGLSQSAYLDYLGDPIVEPNTNYSLRVWLQPQIATPLLSLVATLSSASTGFTSTATITGAEMNANGGWVEVDFDTETPSAIPPDMTFGFYATNNTAAALTLVVDEMSIIYADTPYRDTVLFGSYVNNPEGFDGETGVFGPSQDTHKVMTWAIIRDQMRILTQDPGGRLHDVNSNTNTEPDGWDILEVGQNCGALSAFCLTLSQSDDESGAAGEQWMAWASSSGARIYGGNQALKISQEIQPDWTGKFNPDGSSVPNTGINFQSCLGLWAVNDPVLRVVYFGLPIGTSTAPSLIYSMTYRSLDTAEQIYADAPIKVGFGGRLICTDNTRKWTRWNLAMNGAALMYREIGELTLTLFNGNGSAPGTSLKNAYGNVYILNPAKLTDDDYGQIFSYYILAPLPDVSTEQGLQLGPGRKLLAYVLAYATGVGNLTLSEFVEQLSNLWPNQSVRQLQAAPKEDMNMTGGMAQGSRMFLKFASSPCDPSVSLDNAFSLQRVNAIMKPVKHLPITGSVVK